MKEDEGKIIRHRLFKSEQMFEEAIALANMKHWNSVVNRLYYSCYYAVSALLFQQNINTKTHSGQKNKFNDHYITTGMLSPKSGQVYNELLANRQDGDYADFVIFTQEDVDPLVAETRTFLNDILKLIK